MIDYAYQFLPIILLFFLGVALRHTGILNRHHGDWLLRIVVYAGLPALILATVSRVNLIPEHALLPLSAMVIILTTGLVAWKTSHLLELARPASAVFVIGPMIMNLSVVYPFVLVVWDKEGIAQLVLFDFGNGLLTLTLTYAIAVAYRGYNGAWRDILRRMAAFPPFLALLIALVMNIGGLALPGTVADGLLEFGRYTIYLVVLALGIYFNFRAGEMRAVLAALGLRPVLGLALGWLLVELFDFQGITRSVVLVASAAPIGFNALVYASLEGLDRDYAANIVSLSLLLSLFYIPVMLYIL